jgi:hypothetical protein
MYASVCEKLQAPYNCIVLDDGVLWPVSSQAVREAQVDAMMARYRYRDAPGYPSVISPKKLDPVSYLWCRFCKKSLLMVPPKTPASTEILLQYPVSVPKGPKKHTSPFRLIFTDPKMVKDKSGNRFWRSSFQGLVRYLYRDKHEQISLTFG